jgi:hypothetical protein
MWLLGWCDALERDLGIIANAIHKADAAAPETAAEPLENAHWRLDSSREKLHAIIALAFGVPSLEFKDGTKKPPAFRINTHKTCEAIGRLSAEHTVAATLLTHDATLKSKFLLRHKIAHSLASIDNLQSAGWIEYGFAKGGQAWGYEGRHLGTFGQVSDGSTAGLIRRARRIAVEGLTALVGAVAALADLVDQVATLEAPPLVWIVDETGQRYRDRDDACERSREAAGIPARPPLLDS